MHPGGRVGAHARRRRRTHEQVVEASEVRRSPSRPATAPRLEARCRATLRAPRVGRDHMDAELVDGRSSRERSQSCSDAWLGCGRRVERAVGKVQRVAAAVELGRLGRELVDRHVPRVPRRRELEQELLASEYHPEQRVERADPVDRLCAAPVARSTMRASTSGRRPAGAAAGDSATTYFASDRCDSGSSRKSNGNRRSSSLDGGAVVLPVEMRFLPDAAGGGSAPS